MCKYFQFFFLYVFSPCTTRSSSLRTTFSSHLYPFSCTGFSSRTLEAKRCKVSLGFTGTEYKKEGIGIFSFGYA